MARSTSDANSVCYVADAASIGTDESTSRKLLVTEIDLRRFGW
ncbi:MAG: hypothetical protein WCH39_21300 [Schlesneria sp.]